eukprot:TRINITY_DN2012_c0_g1_i2.p1 TRINITY_DN2012_c0_g1~~TRINITY_DN2012_c0_g1_i2.p1  ORF type:complete len:280 (+),score=20.96 TRINITY_DN2012_c0_g1_i2:159-998(+)
MWSANEFFYGPDHGSRPDGHEVDAPPRGPHQLPTQVGYSSGHPEDHQHRHDSPPHSPPRAGSPPGHDERGHAAPYAGAAPLVDHQQDHQPGSPGRSSHPSGPHAAPRDLRRPVGPYAWHSTVYAAPGSVYAAPGNVHAAPGSVYAAPGNVYAAPGHLGAPYPAPVPAAAYYDASHGQLPHTGVYAAPHGETSYPASAPSPKSVELRVPLCCEACGDRIRNGLFVLEGVRAVALDFERQKVSIVGDVNAAKALELVTAIAPGDPTHSRPAGMQNIMYRNM